MNKFNPKVTVTEALSKTNGNQTLLADILDVTKSAVNQWVSSEREFIPEVAAHRYISVFGKRKVR